LKRGGRARITQDFVAGERAGRPRPARGLEPGPEAYHGITVAGFPNMFLLLGPNTGTGHTSTLLFIEPQVEHAVACMQAMRNGRHRWIDVRPDAFRAHNDDLQSRLHDSVWTHCRSWYRLDGGRIIAIFPGFTREYVKAMRRPDMGNYAFG
jgi:cation diffusion facilitator CzcD-associated flavoprotein CzcO